MKLTVGFINGTKSEFDVDKFDYKEYKNVLKLRKDGKLVGLIFANQMTYWFCEESDDEL